MKYNDLVFGFDALYALLREKEVIVIGSQSLHGTNPDLPDQIMVSNEMDVMLTTKLRLGMWISEVVGEGSPYHMENGFYIDNVFPADNLPVLAKNWESRATRIKIKEGDPGMTAVFLSPSDLAISKLALGRDKDFKFVQGMADNGVIDERSIAQILCDDPIVNAQSNDAAKQNLKKITWGCEKPTWRPKP